MGENGTPLYFTYQEMELLYKKRLITYKQLMLYKHRPDKLPIKGYEPITGLSTKTIHSESGDSHSNTMTISSKNKYEKDYNFISNNTAYKLHKSHL